MRNVMSRLVLLIPGLLLSGTLSAQIRLYSIPPVKSEKSTSYTSARKQADGVALPFWDDFSTYTGSPDTSLWMPGSGVYVNRTHALNQPSLGVATFDGATSTGGLYSTDPDAIGLADTLVSRPILLGTISSTEINSVYLSFFWEHEGAQENPDAEDSLRLSFRDQSGSWVVIDVFTAGDVISDSIFQQVIYQVKPEFLHNNFQIRFEEFGRLSGPYDSWHIDYVYLDKGRQVDNKNYFDRSISTLPASILGMYTAVPQKQFFNNPSEYLFSSSVSIYNLDKIFQPIEYSAILSDVNDPSHIYETLNFNTALNPILQGHERRTITTNKPDINAFSPDLDSIYMNLRFYISSGDSILPNGINYRINDTTQAEFVIHDYYAYDDGTAEFGAGLDQSAGRIAYMFVLDRPDIINRVDISFINIGRDMTNTPFNLYVWKRLSDDPADVIYKRENQSVAAIKGFNQFQTIKLPETNVSDTIYIGLEQLTSDFLVVGYDKNNDTGNRMFYNISGDWQKNTDLKGSLMIRPYFSTTDVPLALGENGQKPAVKIYPNPVSSLLFIEGELSGLELYHISGAKAASWGPVAGKTSIDLTGFASGLYILVYRYGESANSQKLVISH
jgi:hypothetical protein